MKPTIKKLLKIAAMTAFTSGVFASKPAHAEPSEFERRVQRAIEIIQTSVVAISSDTVDGGSYGSGFVIDKKAGWIITNFHVVASTQKVWVRTKKSREKIECKVLYHDFTRDLALLQTTNPGDLSNELTVGNSTKLQVGQFVIAAGSPGGFDYSATLGIVSALDRVLPDLNTKLKFIQIDNPLSPGSSGGPLTNLDGELVGVNSRGGAGGTAGFAIPLLAVHEFIKEFKEAPRKSLASFGYLGAVLQPVTAQLRGALGYSGEDAVVISHVHANSAAAQAGLQEGDFLLRMGPVRLYAQNEDELAVTQNLISGIGAGVTQIEGWRKGNKFEKKLVLQGSPPCKTDPIEVRKASLLVHESTQNLCYLLPQNAFIQVTRFWNENQESPEFPQIGDLLVGFLNKNKDLKTELTEALSNIEGKAEVAKVLREGIPKLVLIRGQTKESFKGL